MNKNDFSMVSDYTETLKENAELRTRLGLLKNLIDEKETEAAMSDVTTDWKYKSIDETTEPNALLYTKEIRRILEWLPSKDAVRIFHRFAEEKAAKATADAEAEARKNIEEA